MSEEMVKLSLGEEVVVGHRYGKKVTYCTAYVTKIGRVWVTLASSFTGRTWRMRLDTQNEATSYGYGGSFFRTTQQHEGHITSIAAQDYLTGVGIDLKSGHWTSPAERVALAAAVRKLLEEVSNDQG